MLDYISAVWEHTVALMSGIVGLLIALGLRAWKQSYPNSKINDLPDWLFTVVGLICIFWSGYLAWRDEHRALVNLQERLRSPEFTGELGHFSLCSAGSKSQDTLIVVMGSIVNPYGPPCAILNWSMKLVFPDCRIVQGTVPLWDGGDIHLESAPPAERKMTLVAGKYWPTTASENPIPAGGVTPGWFWADFKDITIDMIIQGNPSVVVEFTDATTKKTHQIVGSLAGDGRQALFGIDDVRNR